MTLEQLRIFVEVAARQHITKAAAHLNMTQSAVSAAITALETRHGVTLFDRVGRSIVLNRTGQLFLKEAQAVLTSAKAAEAALMDLSGLMHGELTIMASQTIGGYWLSPRLATFRRNYPGIELAIRIGNTAEVSDAVANGEVEVGLIEWPSDRRGVSARQIALDEMIVVVASNHPWADGKSRAPTDFSQTQWVLREQGPAPASPSKAFCKGRASISMRLMWRWCCRRTSRSSASLKLASARRWCRGAWFP